MHLQSIRFAERDPKDREPPNSGRYYSYGVDDRALRWILPGLWVIAAAWILASDLVCAATPWLKDLRPSCAPSV